MKTPGSRLKGLELKGLSGSGMQGRGSLELDQEPELQIQGARSIPKPYKTK